MIAPIGAVVRFLHEPLLARCRPLLRRDGRGSLHGGVHPPGTLVTGSCGGVVAGPRADRSRWSVSAPSVLSQSRASAARNCCATRIGAERSRYRTRRRSPGSAVTRPAWASSARCLAIACRVIGRRPARSVAVAGPPEASAARMARRLGSARAVKTCSAIASTSGGIEVADQVAELLRPALGVAVVRLAVDVLGQLGETALDHLEPGART